MYDFMKTIEYIKDIAGQLKEEKIDFADISFEEVYQYICQVYATSENEKIFINLYMNLLTIGLEHRNKREVAEILLLLAHNGMLLLQREAEAFYYKDKAYRLKSKMLYNENLEKIKLWHQKYGETIMTPFMGKGVIYTAMTGNYDDIKEPKYINPEYDYILYTDNPSIKSEVWNVRYIENSENLDNVRLARRIKILGHEYLSDYDFSIWVDAKLEIVGDMDSYKNKYRRSEPMLCFNHYTNDCIYEEKETCLELKNDDPEIMEQQMERYRLEGYPEKNGLIDSGILVRDLHDRNVKKVMETWWSEVMNGSRRDQLSFNYACWKNDFVYDTSDLFIYGNEYVKLYNHK